MANAVERNVGIAVGIMRCSTSDQRLNLEFWSLRSDSNRRPAHYECAALPTELPRLAQPPAETRDERDRQAGAMVGEAREGREHASREISQRSFEQLARRCHNPATALQAPGHTLAGREGPVAGRPLLGWKRGTAMASTLGQPAAAERLHSVEPFRACTRAQLREVERLAERIQVASGEVLAREGRIGREFFLILSGTVAVTQQGRRVNTLGPGDFFGELAAMDPGPRNATVTALSDLDVLIIGPREFAGMADIPGFRDALLKAMARRLRTVDAQLQATHPGSDADPPAAIAPS
jgi:CRP/FNR family cyclic AMP-dependent transcriptional regulator